MDNDVKIGIRRSYPKIKTVWERDPETNRSTLIEGEWATLELGYLKDVIWVWEEKVDGTNCRVIWDGDAVEYAGRREKSELQGNVVDMFEELLLGEKLGKSYPDAQFCIYGEAYGPGIQKKGEEYIPDGNRFMLFDVWSDGLWFNHKWKVKIAEKLDLETPPIVGAGDLDSAIAFARRGFTSVVADKEDVEAEGLILRTGVDLLDRKHRRIMTKVKHSDFQT